MAYPRSNNGVALAWRDGKANSSMNMSTDGVRVYSYGLMIGYRAPKGRRVYVRNASSSDHGRNPGGRFYSITTSGKHMPGVRSAAYQLEHDGWRRWELSDAEFSKRIG
jgi:hypothetical protein